jgi:sterol desaturase/sphingolipid hydroxylase (fatty acid hydroxylase superfamily)
MLNRLVENYAAWLPFLLFWPILFAVAAAEMWRPLHTGRVEPPGRIPANIGLGLINAGLVTIVPLSTVFAAGWAAAQGIGLFNNVALPFALVAAATVAIRSIANYAVHRLSHAVPLLWRIHRVHHADTALDLSTGLRNHPLELAVVVPLLAGAAIVFGLDPWVLMVYEAIALPFALWSHANLRLPPPLDRALRWLLVTPAMHHVHHSARQAETDSNYGDVFSVWDRLFGTYTALDEACLRQVRFGLGEAHDRRAAHLGAQLLSPIRRDPSEA